MGSLSIAEHRIMFKERMKILRENEIENRLQERNEMTSRAHKRTCEERNGEA
jgi:hypothetical protein